MGIIGGLAAMVFWGLALFQAAIISRKIGNLLTLFWMQLFGLAGGLVYLLFNWQLFEISRLPNFVPVLVVIAVLQIIAYLSFYKGMEKGQVSLVSPLGSSWGLVVAILGVIFYGEQLKGSQSLAILLIILGIILISVDFKTIASKKIELLAGVKEGLISMFGWGAALFLLVIPTRNLNWFLPAFVFRFFLLLLLGLYMIYLKKPFVPKSPKLPLTSLFAIGMFDMGAFMGLSLGVQQANSSIVAPIASSNTIITIILARILLKERITLTKVSGIIAVILGIILISL